MGNLNDLITEIVLKETLWLKHYNGKVVNVIDPLKKGRVLVTIAELGYNTPAVGFWCSARFLNSLYIPKIGDWLDVGFISGSRDKPVYYGKANEMDEQIPKNYKGIPGGQIIFEDPKNKIHIKFDASTNALEIGNSDFEKAARDNDAVKSTIVEDVVFWTNFNLWRVTELAAATAYLATIAPPPAPEGIYVTARVAALTAMNIPTDLTGKIIEGSNQTKIGDK